MECSDPYFFMLLNNISVPSYSELHEKPLDPSAFPVPFFRAHPLTTHDSPLLITRTVKSHATEEPLTTLIRTKPSIPKKLPYAPNLVNLQLTHPPRHSYSDAKPATATSTSSSYRCDFPDCDKTFTRPYNLKSHRRTHTFERPFVCPMCPKSFARQHDRNRHAKLHLGIKPFTCQFCTKSFARHDALNRHQRLVFGIPSCARSSPSSHSIRKKSTGST